MKTEKWAKEVRGRIKRTKGFPETVRSNLNQKLNEVRQAVREGDFEKTAKLRQKIEKLVEEHVVPNEKSAWREYAESIGIAVCLALFLRGFVFEAFKIPTGSMIPTLAIGDHLFVNKYIYGIRIPFTKKYIVDFKEVERGEVVVFSFPSEEAKLFLSKKKSGRGCIRDLDEKDMIKRVIGVAGDVIEMKNNVLSVNGKPLERSFLRKKSEGEYMRPYVYSWRETIESGKSYTTRYFSEEGNIFGPITVKPNHVFVMGDNRDNSADGRCWGQVPLENIKGRAIIIWFSITAESNIRWERFGQMIE